MWNFKQKNHQSFLRFETGTFIVYVNYSYIPIIFLNLISNIKYKRYFFIIHLKNIS